MLQAIETLLVSVVPSGRFSEKFCKMETISTESAFGFPADLASSDTTTNC